MTEVRPLVFGSAEVDAAVKRALDALPEDKSVAFIATTSVDRSGADLSVAVKVNDQWSFGGYMRKEYDEPVEGGAVVRWSR